MSKLWLLLFAVLAALTVARGPALGQASGPAFDKAFGPLLDQGRNDDAVRLALRFFETVPPAQRQSAYSMAAGVCIATLDAECAAKLLRVALPFLKSLPLTEVQPSSGGTTLLLMSFYDSVTGGNVMAANGRTAIFDENLPNGRLNPLAAPVLFADLHLLAARQASLAEDFQGAHDHLDKALAATFSLEDEAHDAARLIVRCAAQLLQNHEVQRAERLVYAAQPLFRTISSDSLLAYELLIVTSTLATYRNDFDDASRKLHQAIALLERMRLNQNVRSWLTSSTYTDLLGVETLRRNEDSVRRLLQAHPLAATKNAIQKRGYFTDFGEFSFALAEEFARLGLQDLSPTGWRDMMTAAPRWTPNRLVLDDMQAFGEAAIGLQLTKAGKIEEARKVIVAAARKRLSTLQDWQQKLAYASPMPYWTERLLLEMALAATLAQGTPDSELIFQVHTVFNRSIHNGYDDALASEAAQSSDDRRRIAQSLRTTLYQQADWERAQVVALANRIRATDQPRDMDTVNKRRLTTFNTARAFIEQRRRLQAALDDGRGVEPAATLARVKTLLLPDEALVLHAPALGNLAKVCIRRDQTLVSMQAFDPVPTANAIRLLHAALTADHPASVEADGQYPAAEAVRIGQLLFGGLDDCLRPSTRIYLVSPGGVLGEVPPAALLTEMPPVLGSGYDLRAAHWLIRDHSFVRTTSIDAFTATKKLSKTKRATLDYLGIGDPVLKPQPAHQASADKVASRGSDALQELPETAEEVKQVAALFTPAKARILVRNRATEEEVRLQPLSEFDTIHFATHGLMREEQQDLREPSLVLTPNHDGDAFDDGLLTSTQIAALSLKARLVVLSACNSARYSPTVIDGGIEGLASAFAIAGTASAIASLWPIDSILTRDLITQTFKTARNGIAVADALALAIRQHLDSSSPRPFLHPRFWAPLIVLGDGAMTLASPPEPHDLGPFAPAESAGGDSVVSAVPFGVDFIASVIGNWNGTRSPSLVQRRTIDGSVQWQVEDGRIGAGPVAAAQDVIYSGGYLSFPGGQFGRSEPILRALSGDGKLQWSRSLQGGPDSGAVQALTTDDDQSVLALVGPTRNDGKELRTTLFQIDKHGKDIARRAISAPVGVGGFSYGHLSINKDRTLASINSDLALESHPSGRVDWAGFPIICYVGDGAEVVALDSLHLEERWRLHINQFEVKSSIAMDDGWILVGTTRQVCGTAWHAAVYKVTINGMASLLWQDASPFDTRGTGIRKTDNGIEIVGYADRWVGIRERAGVSSLEVPKIDFSIKRLGNESYVAGEIFSLRLSSEGHEERRDFTAAGFPLVALGLTAGPGGRIVFGEIASRALWMHR